MGIAFDAGCVECVGRSGVAAGRQHNIAFLWRRSAAFLKCHTQVKRNSCNGCFYGAVFYTLKPIMMGKKMYLINC